MTNEEAIKELKEELKEVITWLAIYKHNEEICEPKERRKRAIETAIMALEQQPSEDCISRAKALEMLGDEPENWTDTEKEIQEVNDYRWFKSILEELPPVTPKQPKWIPVSKELPEENIHVLCQFYMGGMAECYHAHGVWHIVGGYRISCDEVVAWMPLPEPYKAESKEMCNMTCKEMNEMGKAFMDGLIEGLEGEE